MSTTAQPKSPAKFNFDTVFGTKGAAPAAQAARTRSAYSAEEVEVIRKEVLAEGKAQATAEIVHAHTMALSAISQSVAALIRNADAATTAMRAESAQLALAVARKLAEQALAKCPCEEILSLVSECMHKLHLEPRLVIRVAAEFADHIKEQVEPLSERNGFAGRVIVVVEPTLTGSACRIEWADGGIEQDLTATFATIEEHVTRWHAAQTGEEN
jgi:flagellar assembly protein FliH